MMTIPVRETSRFRLSAIFLWLFTYTRSVHAFQGHHQRPIIRLLASHPSISIPSKKLRYIRSTLFQSQGVEEDFRFMNDEGQASLSTRWRWRWLSRQTWSQAMRADKKQITELGISFMLTYNFVSNINGSVFMSLAWYITSVRTGLSPLAAGQWKVLLGTYAKLYFFITLFRPLRLAMALGLTSKVAQILDQTQEKFGCSKAVSAGMVLSAMLSIWLMFATCGITLAGALSGVPIWKGV